MALINLSNLDFDQIKISIKDYLRSNSNFTDYDFEGSNLSVIIDILAYNTYIASYNANMVSNEVFIDSATLRENVVSLARNIGYVPRSTKSSIANISFFVITEEPQTSSLTLKKGLVCTSSIFGNQSFTFVIPNDITRPVTNSMATFNNIDIYEGTYITETFTIDPNIVNQRIILGNVNIDTSLIDVEVEREGITRKFKLSNDIIDIDKNSQIYFIQEIEDQRYELIFGDGIFGEKLESGSIIKVSYVVTNGEAANKISNFNFSGRIVNNNNIPITSGISLINTDNESTNGKEIESVSSIRKYAPRRYASQNRAVTAKDYETIIPEIYTQTESVSVFGGEELNPPQYGKVFITIKPINGSYLSNAIKNNIKTKLKKYSVAGIIPEIIDLKYLYLEIDSSIYYNPNSTSGIENLKSIINSNIEKYAKSTELNRYGARFKYSKFLKIIDDSNVAVTSNITRIQIRRDLKPVLNQFAQYEICFGNEFHISNIDGYNIKSSGFKVKNISETLYFGDTPSTNKDKKGTIFIFYLNSKSEPVIIKKSVGSIDYKKGEILISPINIISTSKYSGQPIIEISAIPKSNDVIGKQDLYLQLDTNKTILNMNVDPMSSGTDLSGSYYIQSSSYFNGELTR